MMEMLEIENVNQKSRITLRSLHVAQDVLAGHLFQGPWNHKYSPSNVTSISESFESKYNVRQFFISSLDMLFWCSIWILYMVVHVKGLPRGSVVRDTPVMQKMQDKWVQSLRVIKILLRRHGKSTQYSRLENLHR